MSGDFGIEITERSLRGPDTFPASRANTAAVPVKLGFALERTLSPTHLHRASLKASSTARRPSWAVASAPTRATYSGCSRKKRPPTMIRVLLRRSAPPRGSPQITAAKLSGSNLPSLLTDSPTRSNASPLSRVEEFVDRAYIAPPRTCQPARRKNSCTMNTPKVCWSAGAATRSAERVLSCGAQPRFRRRGASSRRSCCIRASAIVTSVKSQISSSHSFPRYLAAGENKFRNITSSEARDRRERHARVRKRTKPGKTRRWR